MNQAEGTFPSMRLTPTVDTTMDIAPASCLPTASTFFKRSEIRRPLQAPTIVIIDINATADGVPQSTNLVSTFGSTMSNLGRLGRRSRAPLKMTPHVYSFAFWRYSGSQGSVFKSFSLYVSATLEIKQNKTPSNEPIKVVIWLDPATSRSTVRSSCSILSNSQSAIPATTAAQTRKLRKVGSLPSMLFASRTDVQIRKPPTTWNKEGEMNSNAINAMPVSIT
mmetsp:Transcript_9141/g.24798  ORF Transcript_9141/g.24798 Transcript_9141/m.24798 type:complete len:222 (-) Transcript_9141:502-1167(-)